MEPHKEFTFIKGNNGEGKTNLMEAIYFLFNLRALRTGSDMKPLIKRGEKFFSLQAVVRDSWGEREFFFSFTQGQKRLLVDRVKVKPRLFLDHAPVQFFSPDQASLLVESPEVRRRFVDREIFHLFPDYFDTLNSFKGVLRRRNTILKMECDTTLLASLDRSFGPLAWAVSQKRGQLLARLEPYFQRVWGALKPSLPPLSVHFKQNLGGAHSVEELHDLLISGAERDFARGTSTLGPQREDVLFLLEGASSKFFVSHGERKIAALAFTLAFSLLLMESTPRTPLLLLDDLAAELDGPTKKRVLSLLDGLGVQLLLTSIQFPWAIPRRGAYYTISKGALFPSETVGQ